MAAEGMAPQFANASPATRMSSANRSAMLFELAADQRHWNRYHELANRNRLPVGRGQVVKAVEAPGACATDAV